MSTLTLSNTYAKRQEAQLLFTEECRAIYKEIKERKYKGAKSISIALSKVVISAVDSNFMVVYLCILNTENRHCVVVELSSKAKVKHRSFTLEPGNHRTAEELLRSRDSKDKYFSSPQNREKEISLDVLCDSDAPFNDFLGFLFPAVVL